MQTASVAVTPKRSIRIDDELWQAATEKAKDRREAVADVIRRALLAYVSESRVVLTSEVCTCGAGGGEEHYWDSAVCPRNYVAPSRKVR